MKKFIIILLFICIFSNVFAQRDSLKVKKDTNQIFLPKVEKFEVDTSKKESIKKNSKVAIKKPKVTIDTTIQKNIHIPLKATLYSAVLPGLGQFYNKKYWKIPILYGLGITLGYTIDWNNTQYNDYRTSFLIKSQNPGIEDENDPFPRLTVESVRVRKNRFKRDRDFFMILSLGLYLLNVVDATVDGHLKGFDVDDNLSINFEPSFKNIDNQMVMGFQVNLNLK